MKRTFPLLLVFFLVLFPVLGRLDAQVPQLAFIDGTVVNAQGQPLPGVIVSLAHPFLGRSVPVTTNLAGYFSFSNIPINQTYYFEIYWGNQLIYRNTLAVWGPFYHAGAVVVY